MKEPAGKRAFVSYVHENDDLVDELCGVLEAAGIPFWRDRNDLGPGDLWREEIREAIRNGSLVFLACFSAEQVARESSHMNEELTLAVEEFRRMPPGRKWLIPIRFDDTPLPDWDLGAGIRLDDLNYVDLFGSAKVANAASLVTTIHRLMGDRQLSAASAMAAVEQASDANRVDLVRSLTKQMVLDPTRRIDLDELVTKQVHAVTSVIKGEKFGVGPLGGTNLEMEAAVARRAIETWKLGEPFLASLQIAARFSSADDLVPWSTGIRTFVEASNRTVGGYDALNDLRHLPGAFAIFTAGIAAVSSRKWDSLRALVVTSSVPNRYDSSPMALLEATDPHRAFGHSGTTDAMLAYAARMGVTIDDVVTELGTNKHMSKGNAAPFQWFYHVLHPLFADQWPDDDSWGTQFNRAEVFLGLLAEDAFLRVPVAEGRRRYRRSHWIGRAADRMWGSDGGPVHDWAHEIERDGAAWAPLHAGLFGGEVDRATAAVSSYATAFDQVASQRW